MAKSTDSLEPLGTTTPLETRVLGNFQIRVEGYGGRHAQAIGEALLFRHFALAYAEITGKTINQSPKEAFEIVSVVNTVVTIRLKPTVITEDVRAIVATEPITTFHSKPRNGGIPGKKLLPLQPSEVHNSWGTYASR